MAPSILFCIFIQFMRFSQQIHWAGFPSPPPVDILSELSTLTHPSWPYTAWLIASLSYGSPSLWHDSDSWSRWLDDITNAMDMNFGTLGKMVRDREAWRDVVHGVAKSWTQLGHWPTTTTHRPAPWRTVERCWYLRIHFHEFLGS